MRGARLLSGVVLVAVLALPLRGADPVIELGSRRELFVDQTLIGSMKNVSLRLQEPRDEGVAIRFDKPWEGAFCGYATLLKDGERYLAYYRGLPKARADGSEAEVTCVAESKDGIHWTKPELGIFEVDGTKQNNAVIAHMAPFSHNFSPMIDGREGVPSEERFKALAGTSKSGLVAFVSPDGLRWKKLREESVITGGAFDSQNVPLWSESEQCYVCYFRTFTEHMRRISRTTSKDFITWTPAVRMEYDHEPVEQMYTNQTSAYYRAPHIYVAISARFFPGRRILTPEQAKAIRVDPGYFNDCSDAVLMTTRGGNLYNRTFMEGFLKPGIGLENWVSRTNYPALNIIPTEPGKMSFYVNQNYGQPTAHLRRYSLRVDGLIAAHAPYEGGELVTKPFRFSGKTLTVNFSTSAAGGIKVEMQQGDGTPVAGMSVSDSQELIGNELDRMVSWKGGEDVSKLVGKDVRLRFVMKDADLFSLRFGE